MANKKAPICCHCETPMRPDIDIADFICNSCAFSEEGEEEDDTVDHDVPGQMWTDEFW